MVHSPSTQVLLRIVYWISICCLSWLLMQVVHEGGHIAAAMLSGATIEFIDLHPLHISHTLISVDTKSAFIIWAGPFTGIMLPVVMWLLSLKLWQSQSHYFQFFAGFCMVANGAYLSSALFDPVGDVRDLLNLNTDKLFLLLFSVVTIPTGFLLWNNLGNRFGFGENGQEITLKQSVYAAMFLIVWVGFSSCFFPISFVE